MHIGTLDNKFWGKLSPRKEPFERWHSLLDHCCDVAAVSEQLLARPLVRSRLARLAQVVIFPEVWSSRLAVLAFLHDFGKANHAFQGRTGGHIAEATFLLKGNVQRESGLDALEGWSVDDAEMMLRVALGHHGEPPSSQNSDKYARYWMPSIRQTPLKAVAGLVAHARAQWPEAFASNGPVLPGAMSPFWHAWLGLLQLADWLGSDEAADAFPFSIETDGPRLPIARQNAKNLVSGIGFDVTTLREALPSSFDFSAISDYQPTEIQSVAALAKGPVVVLEAETGAGKTEAALWRFARLFAGGKVDALYFALPTRVAAGQIHERVKKIARRLFGPAAPEVVRALPGDVQAGDAKAFSLPDFMTQWTDDKDVDAATLRSRWPAERPKRFLAAPMAVGTIDQALLGTIRVKHAHMRSFCLSRALLVVDEVHASDIYMETLLTRLLDQHSRAGGEALLLSATLGGGARTRLLLGTKRAKRQPMALADACTLPYPSLSWVENGRVCSQSRASRSFSKIVRITPDPAINDPEKLARRALSAADAGGRVLIVRNTVKDAVATAQALEAIAPDHPALFRIGHVATLHHGRFARSDRTFLDEQVEARFGKSEDRRPQILVGTQTLEQSLDICSDHLLTDLAPMDVLLQRIGRLHRHQRARPEHFQTPECIVLAPDNLEAVVNAREKKGPNGFGTVYENILSLAATRRLIDTGAIWKIPSMNRFLVENATHEEALDRLAEQLGATNPRWRDALTDLEGGALAKSQGAHAIAINWEEAACNFQLVDEKAATRLGLGDREVAFATAPPSPFPGGPPIQRLAIPAHLLKGAGDLAPESYEAVQTQACDNGFTFRLGETMFFYNRYGLARVI